MDQIIDNLTLVPADHEALRTVSEPFDFAEPPFDPVHFAIHLVKLMRNNNGLGLAANQIGVCYRIFAMRADPNVVAINPRIVMPSTEEQVLHEGCLTWPGLILKVKRPRHVKVRYQRPNGEIVTETLIGMSARVFQHEMDHLDGITFLQRVNRIHRERALRQWEGRRRRGETIEINYKGDGAPEWTPPAREKISSST